MPSSFGCWRERPIQMSCCPRLPHRHHLNRYERPPMPKWRYLDIRVYSKWRHRITSQEVPSYDWQQPARMRSAWHDSFKSAKECPQQLHNVPMVQWAHHPHQVGAIFDCFAKLCSPSVVHFNLWNFQRIPLLPWMPFIWLKRGLQTIQQWISRKRFCSIHSQRSLSFSSN